MAWVRRANVVLEVKTDEEAERYLDMGYNITDEWGNVLKACVPTDAGVLRRYYIEHTKTIAQLEAKVAELEAELKNARKSATAAKPATAKATKSKKAEN